MEEIEKLIREDTSHVSPNSDIYVECPHDCKGKGSKYYDSLRDVDFPCNIATRYYEDDNYARAYALYPYDNGVAIICDKRYNRFNIFVLGEDDGVWFINSESYYYWVHGKTDFIDLVTEALSIFNGNFKNIDL